MNVAYKITGLGPLLFGDGRPFSNEEGALNARGLELPFPSTLSSALVNALIPKPAPGQAHPHLNHFLVRGPLLRVTNRVQFPVPLDSVSMEKDAVEHLALVRPGRVRPHPQLGAESGGCDAPPEIARLPSIDLGALERAGYKRRKTMAARYLDEAAMISHLVDTGQDATVVVGDKGPSREQRVGVGIDFKTQTAERGKLFSTQGVYFRTALRRGTDPVRRERADVELVVQTALPNNAPPIETVRMEFGGERRQAILSRTDAPIFGCPGDIENAIAQTHRIRLILATPAQFHGGWLPDWLAAETDCPNARLRFRLVSACVGRRVSVSGWGAGRNRGPKPATWLAPAGSVYFLELIDPPADYADKIAAAWLQPVSDDSKFRRKGFGLALWGTWTEAKESTP